ncbi:hypothetical protein AVEN_190501-1, partial [Araneus ventricosus]
KGLKRIEIHEIYAGFVTVTNRWRSDSHAVTALCHSESEGRREARSDEERQALA